jgi:hypothetical protein
MFFLLFTPRIVSIWRVSQPSDSVHELRESTFSTGSVRVDCHFAVALYAEVCHSMLTQGTIKNYMLIKDYISQDEVNRLYLLCLYKERIKKRIQVRTALKCIIEIVINLKEYKIILNV